jgi:uncharacterized protein CbrC (UPF0167 family)
MTTATDTITQIAKDVLEHCKTPAEDIISHDSKIWDKHFADNWTSIEGDGKTYTGRDEVIAKYKEWQSGVTMHGCEVSGPFVGPNGFSIIFDIDMEPKDGSWPRMNMREVANYTVENGKIIQEEFRFPPMDCGQSC